MSDPLSVTASVAGLVSLAIQVTQGLHNYYVAFKGQSDSISRLCSSLNSLITALDTLRTALENRQSDSSTEEKLLQGMKTSISDCYEIVEELEKELNQIKPSASPNTIKSSIKATGRRLAYPFRESTLQKLQEDVEEVRKNISFALNILGLLNDKHARDNIDDIKSSLELVRATQISEHIRTWLNAPDPSVNHHEACNKRHPTSGLWFLEASEYQDWLCKSGPWLWITGFAGCGKSVLCSSIINDTVRHKIVSSSRRIAVCYFYFTFSDNSKQDVSAMLRSITLQLSHQANNQYKELETLYMANKVSSPSVSMFMGLLQSLIKLFDDVYLLVDAVDECPLEYGREALLTAFLDMHAWANQDLHILLTSRDEWDIRRELQDVTQIVSMENQGVDEDISKYIREHLRNNSVLWEKWSQYHARIEEVLSQRAKGVFRWVECQFQALTRCPVSKRALETLLKSLPRSLDQTYERMLLNINPEFQGQARQIFTILCFATRPLFVQEVVDYLAVHSDDGEEPRFDPECLYRDENDLLEICPGFLHVSEEHISEDFFDIIPTRKLQIAHFSVQEYLVSGRICTTPVSAFHLQAKVAHTQIMQTCLGYLRHIPLSNFLKRKNMKHSYPLCNYAAEKWPFHYTHCEPCKGTTSAVIDYLALNALGPAVWQFANPHYRYPLEVLSPLLLAAAMGLKDVAHLILVRARSKKTAAIELMNQYELIAFNWLDDIDTRSSPIAYEPRISALHIAVVKRNFEIVRLLLEYGMDVDVIECPDNIVKDEQKTSLSYAIANGDIEMTRLLSSWGANSSLAIRCLDTTDLYYPANVDRVLESLKSLQLGLSQCSTRFLYCLIRGAVKHGSVEATVKLLSHGIDITDHKSHQPYGQCPLVLALDEIHFLIAELRRLSFSEDNTHTASKNKLARMYEVFDLLLQQTDQAPGRTICCPFDLIYDALKCGVDLLQKVAKQVVNYCHHTERSKLFTSAACFACICGEIDSARVLLDGGADPNRIIRNFLWRGRHEYDTTLDKVDPMLTVLIERGTGIGVDERLVAAAYLGDVKTVKELAMHDERSTFCLPLTWAAIRGKIEVVKELIGNRYAVLNWGFAPACSSGLVDVVKQFLASGIDMSLSNGEALLLAAISGSVDVVKLLLDAGADPNRSVSGVSTFDLRQLRSTTKIYNDISDGGILACGGHRPYVETYGDYGQRLFSVEAVLPICAACLWGHTGVVKLLLEAGVSANSNSGYHDEDAPLYYAITSENPACVRLLCEAGAALVGPGDVPPFDKSALATVAKLVYTGDPSKSIEMAEVLIKHGAEIDYNALEATEAHFKLHGAEMDYNALEAMEGHFELLKLLRHHKKLREHSQSRSTMDLVKEYQEYQELLRERNRLR